ncbi:MAG: DUF4124 domain-containing protein [Pseudomonadota bacterium]
MARSLPMPTMRSYLLVFLLAAISPARAEIYKFVDENGVVTYTNMPRPGSKPKLVIPDLGAPTKADGTATVPAKPRSSGKVPTPSYFPKVDSGTQRKRDDMRRQLLEEELRSEQRNLSAAKGALVNAGRQPGSDAAKLADAVRMHEKNIEMLNKELSHIR